jgi:histidinol-phosphate/aromatic aminotransferase/cobyric acid decarboxylase-like protein
MMEASNRVILIRLSSDDDRARVATMRHEVYASELGQYPTNDEGTIVDAGPQEWVEILAEMDGELAGFVRVTPPTAHSYSLDRYAERADWGELDFSQTFEVRTLTVAERYRNTFVTLALLYAAYQWTSAHGATDLVVMARVGVTRIYERFGFRSIGMTVRVGSVDYVLMTVVLARILDVVDPHVVRLVQETQRRIDWRLEVPFLSSIDHGDHGGRSIAELGADFTNRSERDVVVPADVLDAWFPPAPGVVDIGGTEASWLYRTSPPALAGGVVAEISHARQVPPECVVVGAGASDLTYRALLRWCTPRSRVLLVRPSYGEYSFLLNDVVGAQVEYLDLSPETGWQVDLERLTGLLARAYDLVVIVNPGNPTGQYIPADVLVDVLRSAPRRTLFWIDETYVEYVDQSHSLESFAAVTTNVIVCKSMSKVYALSGLRVGYLVSPMALAGELAAITPPWQVNLVGHMAAIQALRDQEYYVKRWSETGCLRDQLAVDLAHIGHGVGAGELEVTTGSANFLLLRLPGRNSARCAVERCRREGVYLRDLSALTRSFHGRYVRVAVRDAASNARIVDSIKSFITGLA